MDGSSVSFNKVCLVCGIETPKMKSCSRCRVAKYCSIECQRSDWSTHKRLCTNQPEVGKIAQRAVNDFLKNHKNVVEFISAWSFHARANLKAKAGACILEAIDTTKFTIGFVTTDQHEKL